ncbi:helix-turn-helix domain-containing protein [Nonomuraea sp. KM90]|uniref:helix-turn-helix domain-containing protein n=1 Tax=Nonomuraea sp. KM90 TaxID=3457428 RepID=UPI003FCDE88A
MTGPGAGVDPSPPLAHLTVTAREEAVRRFGILQPHLEDAAALSEVAHTGKISVRTARRWAARYRRGGVAALAPRPREDIGRRRMPEQLQRVIEALALRTPRLSAAAVHRRVQELAPGHGWPVPSYRTVVNVIAALDPALKCLAHEGRKRYADVFELIGRREVDAPNASWQADHTELDFYVLTEDGTPARPWLTLLIDEYSRAIAAHRLSNLPLGSKGSRPRRSKAHLPTSAPFRARTLCPASGRFPATGRLKEQPCRRRSRCLSATDIRFLGILSRRGVPPLLRSAYQTTTAAWTSTGFPRCAHTRYDRGGCPSKPRGQRCSHAQISGTGRRLPPLPAARPCHPGPHPVAQGSL